MRRAWLCGWLLVCAACGDDDGGNMAGADAGVDAGGISSAHCTYQPLPATAGAGGTVTAGELRAGTAERPLGLPVSSAMGGYTGRAGFAGNSGRVDLRAHEYSGAFNPSIGIEGVPLVRALALSAGGETIVLLKADLIFPDDTILHDVADRLSLPGKVLFATSHSHSAPGQFSANSAIGGVGSGVTRANNRRILTDSLAAAADEAVAALRPARLAIVHDPNFDPMDLVNRDRRGENDELAGGSRKDHDLFVIRVDGTDGTPIAVVPVFGMHGIILDADNPLFSRDSTGGVERALEDSFSEPVLVMHLQGLGGDVSPAGRGGVRTIEGDVAHYNFARSESVGRLAVPMIRAAWDAGAQVLRDQVALEMVTRSIELGPNWENFRIRGGALEYAPWDGVRPCDGEIYGGGQILSPIDEFNAPAGAALCEGAAEALFPQAQMPGTEGVFPYNSCIMIDRGGPILGEILDLPFEPEGLVCGSTRTTVSAIRIDEWLIGTLPGEPVTLLGDRVRELSPVPADKTIVVGYAQGEIGYVMTAEDWLLGGYEPSITEWGPLEGEMIAERLGELFPLAVSDARDDAAAGGATRLASPTPDDSEVPAPDPAPMAGMVPATVPPEVYTRGRTVISQAQPPNVGRLGITRFVWIGEDPLTGTPVVTLQRDVGGGVFADVTRPNGRRVQDGDILLFWTPQPLLRTPPRTHYWVAEWQAVPASGELAGVAGLPVGNYRFHVQGTGYSVDSAPFQVTTTVLNVTATAGSGTIQLRVEMNGGGGFRLLDLQVDSDGLVPLRGQAVGVQLDGGAVQSVTLDDTGSATLTGSAAEVRVTDAFGNSGTDAP